MVAFDRAGQSPHALATVDVDPASDTYPTRRRVERPADGWRRAAPLWWNACSSALAHAGHSTDMRLDHAFFLDDDFRGHRAHQVRLQGGDASSASYCHRSCTADMEWPAVKRQAEASVPSARCGRLLASSSGQW